MINKKVLSFSLFDTGETILGALIYSTFFPLYITSHIDTKIYSLVYGLTFLISFLFALKIGNLADIKGLRKQLFSLFATLTALFCFFLGFLTEYPILSLIVFSLMSITHQQSFVFYNSLLLNFENKGFVSGVGVTFGYIGSAVALIFFARFLNIPEVYFFTGLIFILFSLPSILFLGNPHIKQKFNLKEIFKDKRFILTILSILTLTEVANTLIAMMSVYLKNVYNLDNLNIYKVIGFSAVGGILGGIFWGKMVDIFNPNRIFPFGFFMWSLFFIFLPFVNVDFILVIGFYAGFILAHLWTVSRIYLIKNFPESQVSTRMSFLSLTERIASTSGLFIWAFFLAITGDNYKLSAFLMFIFPIIGFFVFSLKDRFN